MCDGGEPVHRSRHKIELKSSHLDGDIISGSAVSLFTSALNEGNVLFEGYLLYRENELFH